MRNSFRQTVLSLISQDSLGEEPGYLTRGGSAISPAARELGKQNFIPKLARDRIFWRAMSKINSERDRLESQRHSIRQINSNLRTSVSRRDRALRNLEATVDRLNLFMRKYEGILTPELREKVYAATCVLSDVEASIYSIGRIHESSVYEENDGQSQLPQNQGRKGENSRRKPLQLPSRFDQGWTEFEWQPLYKGYVYDLPHARQSAVAQWLLDRIRDEILDFCARRGIRGLSKQTQFKLIAAIYHANTNADLSADGVKRYFSRQKVPKNSSLEQ